MSKETLKKSIREIPRRYIHPRQEGLVGEV